MKKVIAHYCSLCNYPCGYFEKRGQVFYDSGCWCLSEQEKPRLCNPSEVKRYLDLLKYKSGDKSNVIHVNFRGRQ